MKAANGTTYSTHDQLMTYEQAKEREKTQGESMNIFLLVKMVGRPGSLQKLRQGKTRKIFSRKVTAYP